MNTMIVLTQPNQIHLARLVTLKYALKLEIKGLRHSSGRSAYTRIKNELGFVGNRVRVLAQLERHLETEHAKLS